MAFPICSEMPILLRQTVERSGMGGDTFVRRRRGWPVVIGLVLSMAAVPGAAQTPPSIEALLSRVSMDSLRLNLEFLTGARPVPVRDSLVVWDPSQENGWVTIVDTVWTMTGRSDPTVAERFLMDRLRQYGYAPVRTDHTFDAPNGGTLVVHNVTATLPGTRGTEAGILVGAHLDAVYGSPGADDNGSGTAGVLEIARVVARFVPERSIIFVFFGQEENGLWGSTGYARDAERRGDRLYAVINLDMIGYSTGAPGMMVASANASSEWLGSKVLETSASLGLDLEPYMAQFGRSDHVSFSRHGYPAVMLIEDYYGDFNPYYHSEHDGMDKLNFGYLQEMTRLALGTVLTLSSSGSVAVEETPSMVRLGVEPYPNPAASVVTFGEDIVGLPVRVRLFDLLGREVMRGETPTLDVSGLASGPYLYLLEGRGGRASGFLGVRR